MAVPLAQASPSQSFVTEHSGSQNRVGHRNTGNYGPFDPATIRNHQRAQSVPLITEHAAGQNGTGQVSATGKYDVSRSAAASAPAAKANGFDWTAAGLGATVAFAAMLLGLAVTRLIPRHSRARLT